MGWIKQSRPPCDHPDLPVLPPLAGNQHIVGDIWKCDVCKVHLEVVYGPDRHDFRGDSLGPDKLVFKADDFKGW